MTDTVVNIHVGEKTALRILREGGHLDTAQEVINALESVAKADARKFGSSKPSYERSSRVEPSGRRKVGPKFRDAPSPAAVSYAERFADNVRRYSETVEAAAWALDEALSALNKDDAGYRTANAANRDGGDNYTPGELEKAVLEAEKRFPWLKPTEPLDKPAPAGYALGNARSQPR